MARPLWLFNLLLALLALVLLGALVKSIVDRRSSNLQPPTSNLPYRASAQESEGEKPLFPLKPPPPPLADFDILLKRDPFKNPFAEAGAPPQAEKPAPPPPPLPTLLGTIFVGEERKAILKDGNRAEIYTLGQAVAGGTLVEIKEDRVLIQRGGGTVEVPLKASIQEVSSPPLSGRRAVKVPSAPQAPPLAPPVIEGEEETPQEATQELLQRRLELLKRRPERARPSPLERRQGLQEIFQRRRQE